MRIKQSCKQGLNAEAVDVEGEIVPTCHDVVLSCGGAHFVAPLAKQGQAALTGLWLEQPLSSQHIKGYILQG
jgi:hypothetical protein